MDFREMKAEQAAHQEWVNTAYGYGLATDDSIRDEIEQTHKEWPQYANHWDGWVLVRITQDITTKAGQAFKAGDITLGHKQELFGYDWYWHVFSFRNNVDTRLKYHVDQL